MKCNAIYPVQKYNTKCPLALRRLIKDAPASRERHNRAVSPRNEVT